MTRIFIFILIFIFSQSASASPTAGTSTGTGTLFKPDSSCVRSFVYRNRSYPVDSSRRLDGEGLKFLLSRNPEAEAMLNDYQNRSRSTALTAYTGSFGAALLLGGALYASSINSSVGQRDTRLAFIFSGLFVIAGSYAYSQFTFQRREKLLEKAVETYNDAVPETERIKVGLMPVPSGTGGEIKTQIPF